MEPGPTVPPQGTSRLVHCSREAGLGQNLVGLVLGCWLVTSFRPNKISSPPLVPLALLAMDANGGAPFPTPTGPGRGFHPCQDVQRCDLRCSVRLIAVGPRVILSRIPQPFFIKKKKANIYQGEESHDHNNNNNPIDLGLGVMMPVTLAMMQHKRELAAF